MKLARRRINRGSRFRKRGKGLKFGARPEKTGAIAHESGAGILAAGAATLKVGAAIGRSGADDFSFGAMAFENGAAFDGVRAVIVKTGATTEKELAYGKKLSSAIGAVARLRGCAVAVASHHVLSSLMACARHLKQPTQACQIIIGIIL